MKNSSFTQLSKTCLQINTKQRVYLKTRPVYVIFCSFLLIISVSNGRNLTQEAFRLLQDQKFEEAIIAYESLTSQSENPENLFNLGIAYYRTLRYSSAQQMFEKTLSLRIEDPGFQSNVEYNIGNCLFQQAKLFLQENKERSFHYLKDSMHAFENAVELQPGFEAARFNLSLATLIFNELEPSIADEEEAHDQNGENTENAPPEEKSESEESESLTGDSKGEPDPMGNNSSSQPDENAKSTDKGGGNKGEEIDVNEAMMLLDAVEMDEKRITLSNLLNKEEYSSEELPNW